MTSPSPVPADQPVTAADVDRLIVRLVPGEDTGATGDRAARAVGFALVAVVQQHLDANYSADDADLFYEVHGTPRTVPRQWVLDILTGLSRRGLDPATIDHLLTCAGDRLK